jgi:hypothetical protein
MEFFFKTQQIDLKVDDIVKDFINVKDNVPILTKEEIYDYIKNIKIDEDGTINIEENLYYKNQVLFEEVQKELDEEYDRIYKKNKPIKKK